MKRGRSLAGGWWRERRARRSRSLSSSFLRPDDDDARSVSRVEKERRTTAFVWTE